MRELHVQPIARFAGLTVADIVRQNDEVFGGVEQLPRAEKLPAKGLREKCTPAAAGAVHNENGVGHYARGVLYRSTEGGVMQVQLRQRFVRGESKIGDHIIAFGGSGKLRGHEGRSER